MYYEANIDGVLKCIGHWEFVLSAEKIEPTEVTRDGKTGRVCGIYGKIPCRIDAAGYNGSWQDELLVVIPNYKLHISIDDGAPVHATCYINVSSVNYVIPYDVEYNSKKSFAQRVATLKNNIANKIIEKLNLDLSKSCFEKELGGKIGRITFGLAERVFDPYDKQML